VECGSRSPNETNKLALSWRPSRGRENGTRAAETKSLITAILVTVAMGGCSAQSNQRVTSMSVISLPPGANLVGDGGFEQSGLGPWTLRLPHEIAAAIDPEVSFSGRRSLRITARAPRLASPLVLEQDAVALPIYATGSRFVLTFRSRTVRLSRPLQTELKLNYAGGGYRFYRGRATGQAPNTWGTGIPPGTSTGWTTTVVSATARFPLESITVFVVDSGLAPLSGTVWIDDIELHESS
jgi:hypothetical protein